MLFVVCLFERGLLVVSADRRIFSKRTQVYLRSSRVAYSSLEHYNRHETAKLILSVIRCSAKTNHFVGLVQVYPKNLKKVLVSEANIPVF